MKIQIYIRSLCPHFIRAKLIFLWEKNNYYYIYHVKKEILWGQLLPHPTPNKVDEPFTTDLPKTQVFKINYYEYLIIFSFKLNCTYQQEMGITKEIVSPSQQEGSNFQ